MHFSSPKMCLITCTTIYCLNVFLITPTFSLSCSSLTPVFLYSRPNETANLMTAISGLHITNTQRPGYLTVGWEGWAALPEARQCAPRESPFPETAGRSPRASITRSNYSQPLSWSSSSDQTAPTALTSCNVEHSCPTASDRNQRSPYTYSK